MPAGRSHRLVNRRRRITRIEFGRVLVMGWDGSIIDAVDVDEVGRTIVGCVCWSAAVIAVGPDCCLLRKVECGAGFESLDTVEPKINPFTMLPDKPTLFIIILGQTWCYVLVSS